jgi:hypothetical protein
VLKKKKKNSRSSYVNLFLVDQDLNFRDLEKEKRPHVVVFVVRVGTMEAGPEARKRTLTLGGGNFDLRRPYGVAIRDISEIFVGNSLEGRISIVLDDLAASFAL